VLASGTQDRGFAPDRSRRIFPAGKIHSMPSFGRGSKIIRLMLVTRITKRSRKGQNGQTVKTVKNDQLWYQKKKYVTDTHPVGTALRGQTEEHAEAIGASRDCVNSPEKGCTFTNAYFPKYFGLRICNYNNDSNILCSNLVGFMLTCRIRR
jgi:hypothetical protein